MEDNERQPQNKFWVNIFWDPNFLKGQHFLRANLFLVSKSQICWGSNKLRGLTFFYCQRLLVVIKNLGSTLFWGQHFFGSTFFRGQNFLGVKIFGGQQNVGVNKFLGSTFVGGNISVA